MRGSAAKCASCTLARCRRGTRRSPPCSPPRPSAPPGRIRQPPRTSTTPPPPNWPIWRRRGMTTETAVNLDQLTASVEGVVGAEHARTGERTEGFAIGAMTPHLVAVPGSAEEVAALLRVADEAGAAVVPWGGGTQQTLGYTPRRYEIAVSLRR